MANVINPKPDDSVGVFGLGGVGLSAIMVSPTTELSQYEPHSLRHPPRLPKH